MPKRSALPERQRQLGRFLGAGRTPETDTRSGCLKIPHDVDTDSAEDAIGSYRTIRFSSKHNIIAYEYRSANMHRAIFEIAGHGEEFTRNDFDSFRKEIDLNVKRSFLSPFAFSIVFDDAAVSPELATEWIDNTDRRGGHASGSS